MQFSIIKQNCSEWNEPKTIFVLKHSVFFKPANYFEQILNNFKICFQFRKGNEIIEGYDLFVWHWKHKNYGREPKSCFGRVFHFKLGSFSFANEVHGANACPCLTLKTRPRFCPADLSLPVATCIKSLIHLNIWPRLSHVN